MLLKRILFLLNAAFTTADLDLMLHVHVALIIMLTQIVMILHILQLFLCCSLYWEWLPNKRILLEFNK